MPDVLTGLKKPTDPGYAPDLGVLAERVHKVNRDLLLRAAQTITKDFHV